MGQQPSSAKERAIRSINSKNAYAFDMHVQTAQLGQNEMGMAWRDALQTGRKLLPLVCLYCKSYSTILRCPWADACHLPQLSAIAKVQ